MSGLNSIASEIAIKKLLCPGRLITEPNMAPTVRNLFKSRTESYFDTTITSVGVMLVKYDLFQYFESWFNFQPIQIGKEFSDIRSKFLRGTYDPSFAALIQTCVLLSLVSKICLSNNFGP